MMANPVSTPLPLAAGALSARLKAKPTSSTSTGKSESVSFVPATSAAPRRAAPPAPSSSDFLSDKATSAFIRRTLCPKTPTRGAPPPIHDLLPPLTSRNDIDLQLYALLSVILREFVQNWYINITPDETFVAEIVQIIAHCTRALEQRLRKVNLESLLLDQLPELLNAHIQAYRLAHNPAAPPPLETDPRTIYHSLFPLPALSPVPDPRDPKTAEAQTENEAAYRQLLVQGILAILLPTEDLENECLTALVGQICSELIIGNLLIGRLSEPWLIWECITLLVVMCHKISAGSKKKSDTSPNPRHGRRKSIQLAFWSFVQWGFLVLNILRLTFTTLVSSTSLPTRSQVKVTNGEKHGTEPLPPPSQVPVAEFSVWYCIGNLLEMDARMPWLSGLISMVQWAVITGPGKFAGFDGVVDRLLSYQINANVLDPDLLPPLLRSIRAAVFPNNVPGAPSLEPPSSSNELRALRRRCANSLWSLVPKGVGRVYFGGIPWPWTTSRKGHERYGPLEGGSCAVPDSARSLGASQESLQQNPGHQTSTKTIKSDRYQKGPVTRHDNKPAHHSDEIDGESQQGNSQEYGQGEGRKSVSDWNDGAEDDRIISEIEECILDVFSDAYCNKHLIYAALELVLIRLMPELAESSVVDLWGDRLS